MQDLDIFSKPNSVLMTANGTLDKHIDLKMLCVSISPAACKNAGIVKFIGFSKIYFYDPEYSFHSDENKYFFNQCSFEFKNKIIIKLFSNGTYIITGCKNETDAQLCISKLLPVLSGRKYAYLPKSMQDDVTSRLALIYDVPTCNWKTFKVSLVNYSITLKDFEFNKYKVINIASIVETENERRQIESVTDIFKYSSVSIKLRNVNGNIDIYKNKVIISVQTSEHYSILLNFFDKYKYKLISIPATTTISKFVFINLACKLRNDEDDNAELLYASELTKQESIEIPKKIKMLTDNILTKINNF